MLENVNILIEQILAIITAISVIVAYLKNRKANEESERADDADKEAQAAFDHAYEVQAFFDPENTEVWTPPKGTPTRSYTMSPEARSFLVSGESYEDQKKMIDQVDAAEAAGLIDYKVVYSRGYYNISYGQIAGGVRFA